MKSYAVLIATLFISAFQLAMIKGNVDFLAKANPGFLEIEGKGGRLVGKSVTIDKNGLLTGTFSVSLKDFKTGIEARDGHMRDYLEADKYPDVTLKMEPIQITGGTVKAFKGELTLHGVTKPVAGVVQLSSTNARATFTVDVTQYGVKVPTYKLLTVGKDVEISVTLDLI